MKTVSVLCARMGAAARRAARASTRRGFTLTELLVVVAVMALILALLMPAVGILLDSARAAKCRSGMHEWGVALNAYLVDKQGVFPLEGMSVGGLKLDKAGAWFNVLPPYMNSPTLRDVRVDDRPGDLSAFRCPSVRVKALPRDSAEFPFCYGYNLWIDHPTSQRTDDQGFASKMPDLLSLSNLDDPSHFVVFGEVDSRTFDNMAGMHQVFRHKNGKVANMCFADGRAAGYEKRFVYVDPNEAGAKALNRGVMWNPEKKIVHEEVDVR